MAESLVQVTEGSGKKLHTWDRTIGANLVQDEAVWLMDTPYATYDLSFDAASTATANSHIIQLMAGASLNVYVHRIALYQLGLATTAAFGQINVVRLSTAGTGGTAFTPIQQDPSDAGAGATGMTLPGVKGTEGNLLGRSTAYFIQTAGASMVVPGPIWTWPPLGDDPSLKPIRIVAGVANGIAVKMVTAIAGATVVGTVWFTEQNF